MNAKPRLCCFDLGGVLVRICSTWAEGCAAAGVPDRTTEASERRLWAKLMPINDEHQKGLIDGPTYAGRLSDALDGLYSAEELLAVHRAWVTGVYDGGVELLRDLRGAGIITTALSNTNAEHWNGLRGIEVMDALDHRLASHEIGLLKPDPAIYRHVEQTLGCRGPEIVFFDDMTDNVQAAADAGWRAYEIDPLQPTVPQMRRVLETVIS